MHLVRRHPGRYRGSPIFLRRAAGAAGINMKIPRGKVVAIMGGPVAVKRRFCAALAASCGRPAGVFAWKTPDVRHVPGRAVQAAPTHGHAVPVRRFVSPTCRYSTMWLSHAGTHRSVGEMIRDLVLMKLEAVGLRGAHRLMPGELSGGMARRWRWRALASIPCWSCTTNLSPASIDRAGRDRPVDPQAERCAGATSIMVTHDIHESLLIVDYIYF